MTVENSLRRRATQARYFAVLWISIATLVLIGTYVSLPSVASRTFTYISQVEPGHSLTGSATGADSRSAVYTQLFASVTLILATAVILFACFLLARAAFVEIELSARFCGLADALCVGGENLDQFEKAAELLVPKSNYFSIPEIFSPKDRESAIEFLKLLRGK